MKKLLNKKEQKKLKALTASELSYYNKKNKWTLDNESAPQRTQRRFRESPRVKLHLPLQTYGLNFEILSIQISLIFLMLTAFTFCCYFSKLHFFIFFFTFILGMILLLARSSGVLRQYKIFWWRPWRIFGHIFTHGNKTVKFNIFLLIFYLKVNVVFTVMLLFAYWALKIWKQGMFYAVFRKFAKEFLIRYGLGGMELFGHFWIKTRKQLVTIKRWLSGKKTKLKKTKLKKTKLKKNKAKSS